MKVLTLSSSEEVKAVTAEKLQTEKYDKIVINDVKDLDSKFYTKFSEYVSEIEATDCTMSGHIINIKECTCTFKNTNLGSNVIRCDSSTIIIDSSPNHKDILNIDPDKGILNFTLLNSTNVNIDFGTWNDSSLSEQFGSITFSNCSELNIGHLPLSAIPTTDASAFMAQFKNLSTVVDFIMIGANNYKISQEDWNKATKLLDQYPSLLHKFFIKPGSMKIYNSSSNVYFHIPSLTFPLPWFTSFLEHYHGFSYKMAIVFLNKNNKPNFTVTHTTNINRGYNVSFYGSPFFIADNYSDVAKYRGVDHTYYNMKSNGPEYYEPSMLSGRLVTSEITLMPNSLFIIGTIDQDLQKHTTKVRTGMYGKTIKITSMEPFGALKVFGAKASEISGDLEVSKEVNG